MVEDLGVVSESTAVIQSSAVVGAASLPELMHGEQLAVDISARVGRTNRSRVKVRVIGNASLTWVDLVYQWGGCVEVVVLSNAQLRDYLKSKYQSTVMSLPQAVKLPPPMSPGTVWSLPQLALCKTEWTFKLFLMPGCLATLSLRSMAVFHVGKRCRWYPTTLLFTL